MLKLILCKIFDVDTKSTRNLFMQILDKSHQLMDGNRTTVQFMVHSDHLMDGLTKLSGDLNKLYFFFGLILYGVSVSQSIEN
jgi:hypothetical protein